MLVVVCFTRFASIALLHSLTHSLTHSLACFTHSPTHSLADTVVELNVVEDGPALRAELGELTGRTSVPAVWIRGAGFVGGCNDGPMGGVNSLDQKGELKPLLEAAGAL